MHKHQRHGHSSDLMLYNHSLCSHQIRWRLAADLRWRYASGMYVDEGPKTVEVVAGTNIK
jgi:hypothetical protein